MLGILAALFVDLILRISLSSPSFFFLWFAYVASNDFCFALLGLRDYCELFTLVQLWHIFSLLRLILFLYLLLHDLQW